MKIRLIVFLSIAVLGLQGSQAQIYDALEMITSNLNTEKFVPIIFYSSHKDYGRDTIFEVEKYRERIFQAFSSDPFIVTLSDIIDGERVIAKTTLKKVTYDPSNNYMTQWFGHDSFLEHLKHNRGIFIFDIFNEHSFFEMQQFSGFIINSLTEKGSSLLIVADPKFDIEELLIRNGVKPIVYNKPKRGMIAWCQNHWFITSLSMVALFALICGVVKVVRK